MGEFSVVAESQDGRTECTSVGGEVREDSPKQLQVFLPGGLRAAIPQG